MQKTLFSLLLLMPLTLSAQSWHIAATGGVLLNTTTSKPVWYEKMSNKPGGAASIEAGYTRNRWEGGLSISYRRYAVWHEGVIYVTDAYHPLGQPFDIKSLETFPTLAITPFVRRHFGKGKADFYTGINAGVATLPSGINTTFLGGDFRDRGETSPGFTAGIHGGCNYSIAKRWAVRTELSVDAVWLKTFSLQGSMFTAGVQYRIN